MNQDLALKRPSPTNRERKDIEIDIAWSVRKVASKTLYLV
jgi:hypothetical protein